MDVISTDTAILVNFGMNVYYMVPALRESKQPVDPNHSRDDIEPHGLKARIWKPCQAIARKSAQDLIAYVGHPVFLPSFAGALLYLTVLSFSGQMVTWLLSAGYDSALIAATRAISVACEFLATWIAPWLMGRIGTTRAGLWLACWQIACLVAGMTVFWEFFDFPLISASGIVGGTILSRIGLRGFDLCAQIIVQE
ncbi:hypothetical protein LTR66_017044, partial [Elasticomyces elasticus]